MKVKIRDRLVLGAVSGLVANIPKLIIGSAAIKLKISDIDGPQVAAGIFVPGHKLTTAPGRMVGYLADSTIAVILGTVTVYALSVTGKDRAALKGAGMGSIMWQAVYGLLTSFGASNIKSHSPKTVIAEFASHTAFGIAAALVATRLGDEGLFTGRIPLTASSVSAKGLFRSLAGP